MVVCREDWNGSWLKTPSLSLPVVISNDEGWKYYFVSECKGKKNSNPKEKKQGNRGSMLFIPDILLSFYYYFVFQNVPASNWIGFCK